MFFLFVLEFCAFLFRILLAESRTPWDFPCMFSTSLSVRVFRSKFSISVWVRILLPVVPYGFVPDSLCSSKPLSALFKLLRFFFASLFCSRSIEHVSGFFF